MKIKDISHWTISLENEALLYFAQRMDELLFTYTLDTYKPPCLTASSLVSEAISTLKDIENGVLDQQTLIPIIEELEWSIKDDPISKSLFNLPYKKIFNQINEKPVNEAKTKLEILKNSIKTTHYLTACFETLRTALKENKKQTIDIVSRTLASTLINKGISKEYLREIVNLHFFSPKITSFEEISLDSFFEKIPKSKIHYEVFFSTSRLIKEIYETSEIFNIHEYKESSYESEMQDFVKGQLPKENPIVCIKKTLAFDKYSAYKSAETKLEKIANLYSIFHHKSSICWESKAIAYNTENKSFYVVEKPNNATQNGFDLTPQKASKHLNNVIRNFSMSTDSSFFKFDSVVDLHGLASKSDSESSQLLNIWIAIETITPPNKKKSKIQNIIDSNLPFLLNTYIQRLLLNIKGDIYRWNKSEYRKIIRKIRSRELSPLEKIASFITLTEHDSPRSELLAKLSEFPLLRNRIFKLNDTLKNPKSVTQLLELHRKKVEWQIRRIYRTRNLIVHSGKSPSYIQTLVENSHDYLDQITNEIMKSCAEKRDATTIEQVYEIQKIKYESYIEKLNSIKELSQENFMSIYKIQ